MIDNLIKPITKDTPTGKDLRTNIGADSIYYQAKDARNTARQIERKIQTGSNDSGDAPCWDMVINLCEEILINHSKDLEVAVWLIEALIRKSGFAGLKLGFDLLYQLINKYWDDIYPHPDEDGITTRIMPLVGLNGEDSAGLLTQPIRNIAITEGTSIGPFVLWQYQQALASTNITDSKIKTKKAEQGEALIEHIQKALGETRPEFYVKLRADLKAAIESFINLNKLLDKKCGKLAPPTSQIMRDLEIFNTHINYIVQDVSAFNEIKTETPAIKINSKSNSILSERTQALQQLEKIADFFKETEPHSPIPYMLARAAKLGNMPFPDLLKELINDENARKNVFALTGLL
jgi:type VI secretion system protein ImpA